ncbi:hypothetical protein [uncultured Gammaproteobacteria bacterium]|nr:hypothetical protein [uncultured Gammaproteobacteria bacterium]
MINHQCATTRVISRPLKTISKQTKKHPSTHNQNQQNCFSA